MKALMTIFVVLSIVGCVSEPARIAQTPSGAAEVTITTQSASTIHDALIALFAADGWQIAADHGASVSFRREMNASRAAGKSFSDSIISGKKGGAYQDEITIALISGGNGTRVIARMYTVEQWPGGQTQRYEESGNETFNNLQSLLIELRKAADGV